MSQGKLTIASVSVVLVLMLPAAPGFPLSAPDATEFFTLAPCRAIDTRLPDGPLGGPALVAGADRAFPLVGACGIPSGATAVSVNLAATGATDAGNLRLHAGGTQVPLVSAVNYSAGQTRSNNAVVPLSPTGALAAFVGAAAGTVHFILDVNGYFFVNPCAALGNSQHFDRTGGQQVSGCPGHVPQANVATLCSPSCHACSASEWDTYRKSLPNQGVGNNIPSHIYWTSDVLGYSGMANTWAAIPLANSPPGTCTGSLGGFSVAPGPSTSDAEGNAVLGAGPAGYLFHDPIEYFFGCTSNNFAGALCCCP